ncbi:hypothetical protein DFP72DRAFT_884723 [Ephemerocybe angulata]|uniref:Uncharacterized protein n=1 Tax=Ephemerocybe angulata TaxID=980116 RepID=A0A8H6I6X7_9AGAR|nr:hypothetical protein DFP72DRAFT_884723 [Tulosesus angulatus]
MSSMIRTASSLRAASRLAAARSTARAVVARSYATPSQPAADVNNLDPENVPAIPRGTLPPRGWDDMLERRNIGEPIHEQEELLSMWGPDVPSVPPEEATRHFLIALAGFVSFGFFVKYVLAPEPPVVRRQYPYDGLVKELGGLEENKARPLVESE